MSQSDKKPELNQERVGELEKNINMGKKYASGYYGLKKTEISSQILKKISKKEFIYSK